MTEVLPTTEVLPQTLPPAHDHQPSATVAVPPHTGYEYQPPAMVATPPHTIPASAPPSAAAPTQHPGVAPSHPGTHTGTPSVAHRGREKLHWPPEVWHRLDHAVRTEVERTRVAAKFLPIHRVPEKTTSIESDIVILPQITGPGAGPGGPLGIGSTGNGGGIITRGNPPSQPLTPENTFFVDEGATTRLIEFWVEFSMTPQQVFQ